jgi:hypothetical protein
VIIYILYNELELSLYTTQPILPLRTQNAGFKDSHNSERMLAFSGEANHAKIKTLYIVVFGSLNNTVSCHLMQRPQDATSSGIQPTYTALALSL